MRTAVKTGILVLLLIAGCGPATAQSEKPLKPIFDKEKNITNFFLSPGLLVKVDTLGTGGVNLRDGGGERPIAGEALRLVAYITFKGRSYSTPGEVILAFESFHYRGFQYAVHRDLIIRTSDREFTLGKMNVTGRRMAGNTAFFETLELSIPVVQYQEIIFAKTIEGSLGPTRFHLNADQVKTLQMIAKQYLK